MTKRNEVYRCKHCGAIVEVINPAGGTLYCCGEPMELLTENTVDAAKEKHVPVVEKVEGGYKVKVGEVEHPMLDNHYIGWVELLGEDTVQRRYLKPGEKPETVFYTKEEGVKAREYCNLHGHWSTK